MQDYHGPTFSLRGFIRFICTDGQYKKIYENIIGHPRKDYHVSVILDTSLSMCGMTAVGSMKAFIGLAASLHGCGVPFNLLTAGAETHLIKDIREDWGPVAKARAFSAIKFEDQQSNIADAVLYGAHLAQQGATSKTVKIVLVLTDGFDAAPARLRQSLALAEAQDVMVVGIGIGYFTEAVFDFFHHYVVVNDPKLLPAGLRRLFTGEGSSERPMRDVIEEERSVESRGRVLSSVQEVWEHEMREVYKEQVERNRAALYLATAPIRQKCNSLALDVCFVMDTTGSMSSHIENAKRYVVAMANDVKSNIASSGKTADLKMAFVTYTFFDQAGHLHHHKFSDDIDSVMTTVNSMRASGGSFTDGNEDKFGGLDVAMSFQWTGSAKFLVLIGDMPDHILHCSSCSLCQRARASRNPGGILELVRRMAREKIHLFYVRITSCTRNEEIRFQNEYRAAAPKAMQEKGFRLLDISGSGAANNMMAEITEHINQVIAEEFM